MHTTKKPDSKRRNENVVASKLSMALSQKLAWGGQKDWHILWWKTTHSLTPPLADDMTQIVNKTVMKKDDDPSIFFEPISEVQNRYNIANRKLKNTLL